MQEGFFNFWKLGLLYSIWDSRTKIEAREVSKKEIKERMRRAKEKTSVINKILKESDKFYELHEYLYVDKTKYLVNFVRKEDIFAIKIKNIFI